MKTKPISDERLSAYLDGELAPRERERLESQLESSPEARERLDQLRGLVADLRSIEREAPPDELYHRLVRRLALDAEARPLERKLAERRGRYLALQPTVWTLLAVVLALAVFVVLLARAWVPADDGPTGAADALSGALQLRVIGDRVFERHAGEWRERGAGEAPRRRVVLDSPEGRRLLSELPGLSELWQEPEVERVILSLDGETVALVSESPRR